VKAAARRRPRRAPADAHPYRMKDLCELTGLPRQAIHFYIQQGLLPAGRKTGRNMAFYGPAHVERVKVIRQLQHERFLPLKAIRALLDEEADGYSPEQQRLLADVRQHLTPTLGVAAPGVPETALAALPLLERHGLDREDLDDLEQAGLLHTREDEPGRPLVAANDAWMLELFGELRAAGFTRELGFSGKDLAIYQAAIAQLFQAEKRLFTERVATLAPERIAPMVERALLLLNTLLARYRTSLVKNMFATLPKE